IVICTAYSECSWEEIFERIGANDQMVILKKPFDPVEPLQLARAFTEKWRMHRISRQKMEDLEGLIAERTRELRQANDSLQSEIAEHKESERLLRTSEERLRHVVSANPAVIYSLRFENGQLVPTWVSDNLTRLVGQKPE